MAGATVREGWGRRNAFILSTVGWAALVVLLLALPPGWPFVPLLVVPTLYILGGVALLVSATWNARKTKRIRQPIAVGIIVFLLGLLLWFHALDVTHIGGHIYYRIRLALLHERYERIVREEAMRDSAAQWRRSGPIRYRVDPGPPQRVVFQQFGGVIDNCSGIVYDPSDAVAAARGWTSTNGIQEFSAPPDVVKLFGGDIVWCEYLRGFLYLCLHMKPPASGLPSNPVFQATAQKSGLG